MANIMEIKTERVWLRQWRPQDREPFAEMNADLRVMEYFPSPLTRAESDAMVVRCEGTIAQQGWGLWAAEEVSSGKFMGFVGLSVPRIQLPFSPCVEIGWRLAHPFWGQGLATEAARAVLQVGFEQVGLEEIVSFTSVANVRSQRVMQRLGMHPDPAHFDHPTIEVGSRLREHCVYRLSKEEWRQRQQTMLR